MSLSLWIMAKRSNDSKLTLDSRSNPPSLETPSWMYKPSLTSMTLVKCPSALCNIMPTKWYTTPSQCTVLLMDIGPQSIPFLSSYCWNSVRISIIVGNLFTRTRLILWYSVTLHDLHCFLIVSHIRYLPGISPNYIERNVQSNQLHAAENETHLDKHSERRMRDQRTPFREFGSLNCILDKKPP